MQRRNFIKLLGSAGLVTGFGLPKLSKNAEAAEPFKGPYLLHIIARGGIDQSSLSDPRQSTDINHYATVDDAPGGNIGTTGKLKYAPLGRNKDVFEKYYKYMMVFNGIEVSSSHSAGGVWNETGKKSYGYPSITELYAALRGKHLPIPWFLAPSERPPANGGLLGPTKVTQEALARLIDSNVYNKTKSVYFQRPEVVTAIRRYQLEKLEAMKNNSSRLPNVQNAFDNLLSARQGSDQVARIKAVADAQFGTYDYKYEAKYAVALFKAGVCASATIRGPTGRNNVANWDTHTVHDQSINGLTDRLGMVIQSTWEAAENAGIADKLVVYISTDVGRTPHYNAAHGKDHWPKGSSIIMNKNASWGNRVVGMSGPKHEGVKINKATLQKDPNGVYLNAANVHVALRKILGIDQHIVTRKLKLVAEDVDMLNPAHSSPIII